MSTHVHEHPAPTFFALAGFAKAVQEQNQTAVNALLEPYDECPAARIVYMMSVTHAILTLESYVQGTVVIVHTPDSLDPDATPLEVRVAQQCLDLTRETGPRDGARLIMEHLDAAKDDAARGKLAVGLFVVLGSTLHGMLATAPGSVG